MTGLKNVFQILRSKRLGFCRSHSPLPKTNFPDSLLLALPVSVGLSYSWLYYETTKQEKQG
ncbi:MAG: hypothetical protein Q8M94_04365 [Ignavibacteria bacterium]|nr:hypothetical protein [Ignavibacteria bacterium]